MARPATGQVLERDGVRGRTYALRFRALGQRQYVTLGTDADGWTRPKADVELQNVLADVRRGVWRPPAPPASLTPAVEPGFHAFASEWLEGKRLEGLGARTLVDYEWALSYHLLPFFKEHRLAEITVREVDRYKLAKAREGVLSAGTINKTITRLAQILEQAVEYDLIVANPARGRRRRLKADRPRRAFVLPEQLPALLVAAEKYLDGRGRPLLATLAGAGLRIGEALELRRSNVNLARGTLTIEQSKTDAGVRTVDLTPALREELTLWLDKSRFKEPDDYVFPTRRGLQDCRQNVRRRLLIAAIGKANISLAEQKIDPIGPVSPHGLRRTCATLRCAAGDDPVYIASQLGHEDPTFTLRVYAQAVKHRAKLTAAERKAYDEAIEWARMGTGEQIVVPDGEAPLVESEEESRGLQRVL